MYQSARMNPPRFAWGLSPAAVFTAIQMLKTVHAGQRHKFIEAMVPSSDPIASAKRTLLDGITDRNVMTTMGAAQRPRFYPGNPEFNYVYLRDLSNHLYYYDLPEHKRPGKVSTFATFRENTVFPALYHLSSWLPMQTLLFLPYVHICWISEPPTETSLWPNGHLMMMKFADGYTVALQDPEAEQEAPLALEGESMPRLDDNELPEERRVLFAMCAIGKHEGCSGRIESDGVVTLCTCEHHQKRLTEGS